MESVPVAVSYNLGSLGHLIAVTPTTGTKGAQQEKGHVTVVLDTSSSMESWVAKSRGVIQEALLQQGYKENDPFSFIRFCHYSEKVLVCRLTTALRHVIASGGTYMSGVIPLIQDVLYSNNEASHTILVISDGYVFDQNETVAAASQVGKALEEYKNPICACLLRLKTSVNADPDTRALASVGSFCNHSKASVLDVEVYGQNDTSILNLKNAIEKGLQNAGTHGYGYIELSSDRPLFRRLPTSDPISSVRIPCNGETVYLLVSEVPKTVRLGGLEVEVENKNMVPDPEGSLRTFFEFVEQQLKMWCIMGGRESEVQNIVQWVGQLECLVGKMNNEATEEADISTMARARALKKLIQKSSGSLLGRIRRLGNKDRVDQLNAQQQADWLRGVGNTKTGRALAKRAQQTAGDLDYQEQVQAAVRCIAKLPFPADGKHDNHEAVRSFYSLSDPKECLKAAIELVDVVDSLTLGDVLQCVGGVGVPFEAFVADFPDPFALRIKQIYAGQHLAEPDVWLARAQAANTGGSLTCPGRGEDAVITGVIALFGTDEQAYQLYTEGEIRRIFELQASCQIRHVAAPVPYDAVALSAAGVWNFAQTFGEQKNLSTIQFETLRGLVQNLQFLIGTVYKETPFRELYDSMTQNKDPRPWLSGDREVSGVLRPVAVLLRFFDGSVGDVMPEWLPRVLRALYYLDCYHAAKKHFSREEDPAGARESMIVSVLKIDLEDYATPVQPLFEPEPNSPKHFDSVDIDDIEVPQFFPSLDGLVGLEGVLCGHEETTDPVTVFQIAPTVLRLVATVQALMSPHQSDRIDTDKRESLLPDPATVADAMEYLRDIVRGFFAENYKRRVAEKKRQEDSILLKKTIDDLVAVADKEEFCQLLLSSAIQNRQHGGYNTLMERLMVVDKDIPCQLDKLSLLAVGRDVNQPDDAVWNKGNVLNGDWAPLASVIGSLPGGIERLEALGQIRKKYGIHRYRDLSNYHGHGNKFPSYWALGHKNLREMKACVTREEFAAYIQAHCKERGCCLPGKNETAEFGLA